MSAREPRTPQVKKVGPRRVRMEPAPGQRDEPGPEVDPRESVENDERLKADKPPHY